MFAVLQINQSDKGILALMKNTFSKSKIEVKRVRISGAQPFFVISTTQKGKRINWSELEQILGRLSGKLILPNGLTPPVDSNVKQIDITDELPAKMLFNTAIEISKLSALPSQNQKITVVDKTGVYLDQIENLVKHAAVVRVITDKINHYEDVAQDILCDWGASISVSRDFRIALKSDIIISPFEQITGTEALVLSTSACKVLTPKTALSNRVSLPKEFKEFLPAGIDEHDFACTLFDSCKLKSLAEHNFEKMLFCGEEKDVQKIALAL
ncbi:MAG: hypothetical protein RR012_01640 [Oscillospiraceae bacterium]